MAFDHAKLERHESMLRKMHPTLNQLSIVVHTLDEAPIEEIALLIDQAWCRVYGERVRIAYSPAFLRYCMGPESTHGFAVTAWEEGLLQGVILAFPLPVQFQKTSPPAVLTTGLCVTKTWEKQGLLQLLLIRHGLTLAEKGISWSFHWRATKGSKGRSAGQALAYAGSSPLFARPLHLSRAAVMGRISKKEKLGMTLLTFLYACRRFFNRLPKDYVLKPIGQENVDLAVSLLKKCFQTDGVTLNYAPQQLLWETTFHQEDIQAFGWLLSRQGVPLALAHGYINPVYRGERYFALDRLVFDPALKLGERRAFLAKIETHMLQQLDCCAVMMTGTASNEEPGRLGYHAVKKYFWGAMESGELSELSLADLEGLMLPLR
ncbi:MAG: hypothetical protein GX117_07190 [Candidatus Hydrogenedentes bacterium]|nr:hypothetical protein [Candidatus Hydrogenedentota bacterium]